MALAQVESFLSALNNAWLSQDYVALEQLYDADVVLLPPDAGLPIVGRNAVLESYREFHAACRVEKFGITDLQQFRFANTVMVHMRFNIEYQLLQADIPDQPHSEEGLEVYTLLEQPAQRSAKDSHNSRIIWRAQFVL